MTSYESFVSRIYIEASGCPEPLAIQVIRDAAIDFCVRSNFIQRDMDPIAAQEGIGDYDLEPPSQQLVVKIMKCWYKNYELNPVAPDYIKDPAFYNANIPNNPQSTGEPLVFTQKDERTFSVYPIPKETTESALTLRISCKPTRASTSCEDSLFEDYLDVIASGALSRLVSAVGKPYSAPAMVAFYANKFFAGVNEARQRASKGNVRANMQVRMRKI